MQPPPCPTPLSRPVLRALGLLALAGLALMPAIPAGAELNTAPPNAQGQVPAFPGQTRAPEITTPLPIRAELVVAGLEHPWGMALLPDGGWLITERPGRLRLLREGRLSAPIGGVPAVDARRQGGLLDVIADPDFARSRRIWFSFAEPRGGGRTSTSVATARLAPDATALEDLRVIFRQEPPWPSTLHYGSRLVLDGRGGLFVTTGERGLPQPRQLAQDLDTHLGKVLRIDPLTGAGLPGNPFFRGGGRPEIWSWGHRNIQSAALDGRGRLWTVEHGPQGGDELNLPRAGANHGWPLVTYGEDYDGTPIGQGVTAREGIAQPVYYWDPVIAPSGMAVYEGAMFPEMQGDLLIGGLKARSVVRLHLKGDRVAGEQHLVPGLGRIRDVAVAPDGAVMVLTDAPNGGLFRLSRGGRATN